MSDKRNGRGETVVTGKSGKKRQMQEQGVDQEKWLNRRVKMKVCKNERKK